MSFGKSKHIFQANILVGKSAATDRMEAHFKTGMHIQIAVASLDVTLYINMLCINILERHMGVDARGDQRAERSFA